MAVKWKTSQFFRILAILAAATLAVMVLTLLRPVAADALPSGFQEKTVFSGLTEPTTIQFSRDGRVFVAEKSGIIKVFDNLSDTTPSTFADLRTNVHNFWDRGLLGMVLDPDFPANPYVYVLYTHDAAIGGTAPRWGSPGATSDPCPNPPGATADGCVVSGRLSKLTASGNTMAGPEQVLIEDWCQQYPSHSIGSLVFGADRTLYVSGGDGASFNFVDYGQDGNPLNPCGDPPGGVGATLSPPTAEGGALRSQDLRTRGDPVSLDGTILRVDPDTGAGRPDNPLASDSDPNARRIIANGLRNPFRQTLVRRPGTDEIWVGDVGWGDWEEINRVADPTDSTVENFGWPCYEGTGRQGGYDGANLNICENLYAQPSAHTPPHFTYNHNSKVVAGETCPTGSSSIAGLAFYKTGPYPDNYDDALFFADYSRDCIWVMLKGANGLPDPATRATFVAPAANPVDLQIGPNGDLFYADFSGGTIRRIEYSGAPTARATANPTSGPAPLTVSFDGTTSSDPNGDTLSYAWDLDGDGAYDDSTASKPTHTYTTVGNYDVGLEVTDTQGASDTLDQPLRISAGNAPPTATINSPPSTTKWEVGETISFSGSASDQQDGTLAAAALTWNVIIHHCPSNCHEHSYQSFEGVASGSFDAPDHEYPSHLELELTATDSGGLKDTDSVQLDPKTVQLDFRSNPEGLTLVVGSNTSTTPFNRTVIVGSKNSVSAPSPQTLSGTTYEFASWSDGGPQSHDVIASASPSTYTATYNAVNQPPANCTISGTSAGETLTGTSGPDHICGGGGGDTIKGLGGNDILRGEAGADKLYGGEGDDTLDGGTGNDTANYSESLTAVSVSLDTNTATGEGSDTLAGMENLLGSSKNDTLTGSSANNVMKGGAGSDTINGLDGADTLTGAGGNDTMHGGLGNDSVVGSGGADNLFGDEDDDTVNSRDGVSGNDSLDGGPHVSGDTAITDPTERSVVGFP